MSREELAPADRGGEAARLDSGVRRLDQLLDARQARQVGDVAVLQAELEVASARLELARQHGSIDKLRF